MRVSTDLVQIEGVGVWVLVGNKISLCVTLQKLDPLPPSFARLMCNKKDFSHLVLTGWGLPIVSGLEGGKKSALCCSISRDLSPSLLQLIQSFCCSLWSSVSLSFMSWLCKKCFNLESSGGSAFAVVVVKASYNFDKHKLKYYFNYRVAKCLEPVSEESNYVSKVCFLIFFFFSFSGMQNKFH